ncbi:hypothetical protein cypCar_00033063 [Cyprinus carpio]|nr:hypothetical protein cypCar_00033063 [Cyprinus carpio]
MPKMTAVEKLQMLIEAAEYLDRREREAEHGYASMLPFTSNKERDGLKRKIKNKKNCSSRYFHQVSPEIFSLVNPETI